MITRNFILHLTAGLASPLVINVNQYDQGEQWLFTLYNQDGTQYVPSSGAIVGIKSDNLGIINSGTVDSQGRVVINETQQMTASVGKAVFELVIDDGTHGTANFVVLVEPKPGDNADLSESDISMIEEAVEAAANIKPYGSPLVASTVADMTDHDKVYVYTGSETGYTSGNWYYWDGDSWESGGVYNSVAVQTDTTLAISGMAADAKKTGDEISDLKSQITNGVPHAVKVALNHILQNVAFKNDTDYSADKATINAWATSVNVTSITAVYTQSGTVYDTDSLDSLKTDLVVTANYDNGTIATVSDYTLSGTLTDGTSVITVAYSGKTTTFNVTVTALVSTWHLGNGVNQRPVGSLTYLSATTSATRAIYAVSNATYAPLKVDSAQSETNPPDSDLYPMKIPAGAKGVKITTPANVYVAAYDLNYSAESIYKWVRLTTTGWLNPSSENTFTFDLSATHFNLACKHGSAGTATVTQSDVNGVSLAYVYE